MEKQLHLGFPVPLLGLQPVRLPVLYDDGDLIALAKPVGVLVQTESWYPRLPVLIEAIRHQCEQEKPEFTRLGIGTGGLWAVNDLDPECYGPVLFARTRERAEELRNEMGSEAFRFTFCLLSKGRPGKDTLGCELPLARHRNEKRVLVSHTTGKKSETRFSAAGQTGSCRQWLAETAFPRRHQILIHAVESGLPVMGDESYAREKPLLLSRLKRDYQPKRDLEERPLYEGPAYFLMRIQKGDDLVVDCPPQNRWTGLLKQLRRYG
jgi:23S rRNA pseudouridine1911/1915/1917 synthase